MKFGEVYQLKYSGGSERNPKVIVLQSDKEKLYAIRLNTIPLAIQEQIIKLFNKEIFTNFSTDKDLVDMALHRQEIMFEQKIFKILAENKMEMNIKSRTTLLRIMRNYFRCYEIKDIEKIIKVIK
jgi:hypothetical protein